MSIASNYKIEPALIKKIEKIAKIKGTDENQVLNEAIEKGIEKTETPKTVKDIPDYLIANKDAYNPDPERLMKRAGTIHIGKPVNATKLVREMRMGE